MSEKLIGHVICRDDYTVTCQEANGVWMAERRYSWDHENLDRVYGVTMEAALKNLPPPRAFQTY